MTLITRGLAALALVGLLASGGVLAANWEASRTEAARERVRAELAGLEFPAYAPQKVVYEIDQTAGWFDAGYLSVLGSLQNHVAAVGERNIDLRVVLHGPGLGLVDRPGPAVRQRLDALRKQGVRFLVCRNSLIGSATDPGSLYGVAQSDIIPAAVAELADLQAKGFHYLHL